MAITATAVLDRAEKTLLDETNVQWARAELLDYLNAGARFVCLHKPDAYIRNEAILLTTSETRHELPAGGYQLIDIIRNMGAGGVTIGGAIRQIERNHLDHTNIDWHTVTDTKVQHFMFDKRDPKVFWTYPRVTSTHYVQASFSAVPDAVLDNSSDVIPIDDVYETPLYYFVLAMAYIKNSKRGDINKGNAYFTMFANSLGIKSSVQKMFDPIPPESDENPAREPR